MDSPAIPMYHFIIATGQVAVAVQAITRWMSCTGKLGTPCLLSAQFFHLLNAPMYFLVVLSALLCRTVAGKAAARCHNSGSPRLLSSDHTPEARTSVEEERKRSKAVCQIDQSTVAVLQNLSLSVQRL